MKRNDACTFLCVCARLCGLPRIVGLQERTKDTRSRSCSLLSAITEILGKALDYRGRTNGVFVSLLFLKILSWRVFQITEEVMSFHLDFDSLKINYFPWCLHFYLLQLGHYVLAESPWGIALQRAGSFLPHPTAFDLTEIGFCCVYAVFLLHLILEVVHTHLTSR